VEVEGSVVVVVEVAAVVTEAAVVEV